MYIALGCVLGLRDKTALMSTIVRSGFWILDFFFFLLGKFWIYIIHVNFTFPK